MNSHTVLERREFLAAGGLAVLATFHSSGAEAADWTDVEKANVRTVAEFCGAWSTRDLARVLPFLSDDCIYRMTETTPPATGHEGVSQRLKTYVENSEKVEFKILETFASGPIVITRRIDQFVAKQPLTWEGVGVFYVKDGKIKEWSDYTIRVVR